MSFVVKLSIDPPGAESVVVAVSVGADMTANAVILVAEILVLEILVPLILGAVTLTDVFTVPQVTPNRTFKLLSMLALIADKLLVLIFDALSIFILADELTRRPLKEHCDAII